MVTHLLVLIGRIQEKFFLFSSFLILTPNFLPLYAFLSPGFEPGVAWIQSSLDRSAKLKVNFWILDKYVLTFMGHFF